MPLTTSGTVILVGVAVGVALLLFWARKRRRTVALPDSLTSEAAPMRQTMSSSGGDGRTSADAGRSEERSRPTGFELDLTERTLGPDPWT